MEATKEKTSDAHFNTNPLIITNIDQIEEQVNTSFEKIIESIAKYLKEGSGWQIKELLAFYVNIVKYNPLRGNSYIELPKELQHSMKGLVNIKNYDDQCFRWCHLAYKFPANKDKNRITKYMKHITKLNYEGITFPVTIKQIPKIEKQNNISINVFGYEKKIPYPIYISKTKCEDQLDLLLITEGDKNYYVWIKDFDRFMFNITKYKGAKHFCRHCLLHFTTEDLLNQHIPKCFEINGASYYCLTN